MALEDMHTVDRLALLVSTGLMFLGIIVLGFIELIDGVPHGAAPMKNDAGQIVATPTIPPELRTGLVILGLGVLLLLGIYRLIKPVEHREEQPTAQTAD